MSLGKVFPTQWLIAKKGSRRGRGTTLLKKGDSGGYHNEGKPRGEITLKKKKEGVTIPSAVRLAEM